MKYGAWLLLLFMPCVGAATRTEPEQWVEYYRTGSGASGAIEWNLNQIDVNSLVRDGIYIRYRVRVQYAGGQTGEMGNMQADCNSGSRGQHPEPRMSPTYAGTLGAAEVKAACSIAARVLH